MKKMSNTELLERGELTPLLLKLSAPAMIGMFLISLYNVVDAFFVGRGIGAMGIAAVFIMFPASLVIVGSAQAFGAGGASVTSRLLGAKDNERAERVLASVIFYGFATGLAMGIFFFAFTDLLLSALGCSEENLPSASLYARIIFAGAPFFHIMMVMNNLVRGEGNTKLSMFSMAISSGVNIVLDWLFIFVFHWGVAGAAVATDVSQICAVVWLLYYYLSGKSEITLRRKYLFKPELPLLADVLKVGASTCMSNFGLAFSWSVLTRIFASAGGDIAVASSGLIQRLFSIVVMPVIGMGHGLLPIVGYNYGAGRFDRIRSVMRLALVFSNLFCAVCAAVIFLFPAELLSFFAESEEMVQIGVPGSRFIAAGVIFAGCQISIATFYQGVGEGGKALFCSIMRPVIILPGMAVIFTYLWGLTGTWITFTVADWLASAVCMALFYFSYKKLITNDFTAK